MSYHDVYYQCGHRVKTLAYGDLATRKFYLKKISTYPCPDCEALQWDAPAVFLYFLEDRDACGIFAYHCQKYREQFHLSKRGYDFVKFDDYLACGQNGDYLIDNRGYHKIVAPSIRFVSEVNFLSDLGFRHVHAQHIPKDVQRLVKFREPPPPTTKPAFVANQNLQF